MTNSARANPLSGNPLRSRADLQRAVHDLVNPLLPHFSPGGARVRLGSYAAIFQQADAELEGFARPLWGLAPLAAGGGRFDHWDLWQRGLTSGCDPDHPEHWIFYEKAGQTMVEQAAIGFALLLAPEVVWEPLDARAKDNLVAWLSRINVYDPMSSNWQFFRVLVNLGLEAVGRPTDEKAVEASLDLLDSYYLADGWYQDGALGNRDHYIGWAMHAYGLIYARARPDDPRSARFRERARAFAVDFEQWFDSEGGVIPFGRSLTYRFAAAAFWSAAVLADEEVLPWGRIKGLLMRHLRWWRDLPISDRDGVLSLGWGYTQPWMREEYNSAGSPYWAMKAFICLAAPESHPFWQAEELAAPTFEGSRAQPHPGMLLSHEPGQALALSGGHDALEPFNQGKAKYGRFAYSSAFPFGIDPQHTPGDNVLVLRDSKTLVARGRTKVEEHFIRDGLLYSRWQPFDDVVVHTVCCGAAPWHLRAHRIVTGRSLETNETGFAIGLDEFAGQQADCEAGKGELHSPHGATTLLDRSGEREASAAPQLPNTNLMHPFSAVPRLRSHLEPGTHDLICAVGASHDARAVAADRAPEIDPAIHTLLDEVCPHA